MSERNQFDVGYLIIKAERAGKIIKEGVYGLSRADSKLLKNLQQEEGEDIKFFAKDRFFKYEPKRSKFGTLTVIKEKKQKKEEQPGFDLLMWVGSGHYSYIKDFVEEARKLGVCKRIGKLLHGVDPGKTRIFLAHDEGFEGDAVIFGYFTIKQIEVILRRGEKLDESLVDRVVGIDMSQLSEEAERGCGWRDPGGIYFVSYTDEKTIKEIAKQEGVDEVNVKGGLIEFDKYRDYNKLINVGAKRFRGALRINGDDIINSKDYKEAPSTKEPEFNFKESDISGKKDPLTEAELAAIDEMLALGYRKYQAFRILGRITDRKHTQLLYKYKKYHGK